MFDPYIDRKILYFSVLRDVVTAMRGDKYSVSMLVDRRKERSYALNLIDLRVEDLAIMVHVSKFLKFMFLHSA